MAVHIPSYDQLIPAVLAALKSAGGSAAISELNDATVQVLRLSDDVWDVPHKTKDGDSGSELEYRLRWTRTILKSAGLATNSARGVWVLTNPDIDPASVSSTEVMRLHRANERTDTKRNDKVSVTTISSEPSQKATVSDADWTQRLLDFVQSIAPDQFERLAQRLLREAGFVEVHVTGRTGDGGIDGKGIVRVNHIVSFHVVFQCKRYVGTVSGEEVRAFRGAVEGRADRGLFITSGRYTPSARAEATREGARPIDLIDGAELAEMLRHFGLGVRTKMVEEVELDEDWFNQL